MKKIHEFSITKKGEYLLPRDVIRFARKNIEDAYHSNKRYVDKNVVKDKTYTQTYVPLKSG